MKLITRDTDYAVRALAYIAQSKNEVVTASELVKKLLIPRPFMRKILQALNRAAILKSYKGQGGGFSLEAAPENIRLVDLVRIFQGSLEFNECLFKKKICPNRSTCALRSRIGNIERKLIKELEAVDLASLLR
jgi:Rrf2 family protein